MQSLDLIVNDVLEAGEFLRTVAPVEAKHEEAEFACYSSDGVEIMFSRTAMVDTSYELRGLILHFRVPNVDEAADRLQALGYEPVFGPENTDWGTRSVMYRDERFGFTVDLMASI